MSDMKISATDVRKLGRKSFLAKLMVDQMRFSFTFLVILIFSSLFMVSLLYKETPVTHLVPAVLWSVADTICVYIATTSIYTTLGLLFISSSYLKIRYKNLNRKAEILARSAEHLSPKDVYYVIREHNLITKQVFTYGNTMKYVNFLFYVYCPFVCNVFFFSAFFVHFEFAETILKLTCAVVGVGAVFGTYFGSSFSIMVNREVTELIL